MHLQNKHKKHIYGHPPSMDSSILTDNTYNPGKFQTFFNELKQNPASTISTMF